MRQSLGLLSTRDRRLLGASIGMQMATSLLDLVGVLLIGVVGALAITTVQSQPPPDVVQSGQQSLGLERLSDQDLVLLISAVAAFLLLLRSLINAWLTRRILRFLANRQALVSARLSAALLSMPITFLQRRSTQETGYALISGASAATIQLLGQLSILASEGALLLLMAITLLMISPWTTLGAVVFFALIAFGLQWATGNWASRSGSKLAAADVQSLRAVQEALGAYREISVSHRRQHYVNRIEDLRWQAASVVADTQYIGMLPKFVFEAALVVGGFVLAGALYATQDSVAATGTLALFLAAGSRVMPSLLRLQGAALGMRGSAGVAQPTLALAAELRLEASAFPASVQSSDERSIPRLTEPPAIRVKFAHVTFAYPQAHSPAVKDLSFEIPAGRTTALVGSSGAGKSTVADLMLGVLRPDEGEILMGSGDPAEVIQRWPGIAAYVPQEVLLVEATIRDNVALGLPLSLIDDDLVWEALSKAHLDQFVREQGGLTAEVGERGVRLSGGQRQRLGLARALYQQPRLLVLDEATSALDAETESSVAASITDLGERVTKVIIAHRLSTIQNAEQVVYIEHGRAVSAGTFAEVCSAVPALARQAKMMGLTIGDV
jgi:ABC-type multidrug transport system fused ATPase/permease subunit